MRGQVHTGLADPPDQLRAQRAVAHRPAPDPEEPVVHPVLLGRGPLTRPPVGLAQQRLPVGHQGPGHRHVHPLVGLERGHQLAGGTGRALPPHPVQQAQHRPVVGRPLAAERRVAGHHLRPQRVVVHPGRTAARVQQQHRVDAEQLARLVTGRGGLVRVVERAGHGIGQQPPHHERALVTDQPPVARQLLGVPRRSQQRRRPAPGLALVHQAQVVVKGLRARPRPGSAVDDRARRLRQPHLGHRPVPARLGLRLTAVARLTGHDALPEPPGVSGVPGTGLVSAPIAEPDTAARSADGDTSDGDTSTGIQGVIAPWYPRPLRACPPLRSGCSHLTSHHDPTHTEPHPPRLASTRAPTHQHPNTTKAPDRAGQGPSDGGRYWDRTSDLFGVNEALSR